MTKKYNSICALLQSGKRIISFKKKYGEHVLYELIESYKNYELLRFRMKMAERMNYNRLEDSFNKGDLDAKTVVKLAENRGYTHEETAKICMVSGASIVSRWKTTNRANLKAIFPLIKILDQDNNEESEESILKKIF